MPNNKGYIYRSVYCYGEKKAEVGQPTVLFETIKGGTLMIHEWTPTEYKVWKKVGDERKTLVKSEHRNKLTLNNAPSIMNYLKK